MKIRHKRSGVVLEGDFADCADCTHLRPLYFYDCVDGSRYHKEVWEEVPKRYRDVTAECEWVKHPCGEIEEKWRNDWYIRHEGRRVEGCPETYRVRKVELLSQDRIQEIVEAFIIEKEEA